VGLRLSLDAEPDMVVVGEAATGRLAAALAREHRPDVLLLDVALGEGDLDGAEACRRVLEASPRTAVLLLGEGRRDAAVLRGLAAGARGALAKGAELAELKRAVRAAHQGAAAGGLRAVAAGGAAPAEPLARPEPRPAAAPLRLSETDLAIVRLVAEGRSNKEIGARVHLSPYTVKDHLKKVATALSVRSRSAIVAQALRRGLL
jgi:DNA-binding NarL/FixJ family response regulator